MSKSSQPLDEFVVRRGDGWFEVNFDPDAMKQKSPLVSVSVTTYQHENYIAQTLDSIIAQETDFDFEILLGEDCSKDGTRDVCLEYARRYPDLIRLILHDRSNLISINGRPTGRFNWITNLESSRGTFVALCEGDDYWNDPKKLQQQASFLQSHENYSLSFHDCCTIEPDGKTIQEHLLGDQGRDLSQTDLIRGRRVPTLTAMFRRKYLENMPPEFLDVLNADTFIFAFLGQKGPAKFQPEIQPAAYRIHPGGLWSSTNVLRRTDDLIATFQAIAVSTDPAFQPAARAELKSKYAMKLLACLRWREPRQFVDTLGSCSSELGWTSLPGVFARSVKLYGARIANRLTSRRSKQNP